MRFGGTWGNRGRGLATLALAGVWVLFRRPAATEAGASGAASGDAGTSRTEDLATPDDLRAAARPDVAGTRSAALTDAADPSLARAFWVCLLVTSPSPPD